jgi:hypothetical protein
VGLHPSDEPLYKVSSEILIGNDAIIEKFTRRLEMEPTGLLRLMAPLMSGMFRKVNAGVWRISSECWKPGGSRVMGALRFPAI